MNVAWSSIVLVCAAFSGSVACTRGQSMVNEVAMSTDREAGATRLPRASRVAMLFIRCGAETLSASPALPANTLTGAFMKLSISYKSVDSRETVEAQSERHVNKLARLLKSYEPDLVQLHGVFSKNPHKQEHSFSLNLSLPTGTLHATGIGDDARAS